jgi:hypothetical protein
MYMYASIDVEGDWLYSFSKTEYIDSVCGCWTVLAVDYFVGYHTQKQAKQAQTNTKIRNIHKFG